MSNSNEPQGQAKGHDKDVEIIVNGRKKTVTGKEITFEAVVKLAFDNAFENPNTVYTATYAKGGEKQEGPLVAGQSVKLKDGMVFSVTPTDKS